MNWPVRNATVAKYHTDIINIIEQTPHNYTHTGALAAKNQLIRFIVRQQGPKWLTVEEYVAVKESANIGSYWWFKYQHVSLQFLMDLATHILYAKGIDVWEVIMTTERSKNV